MDPKIVEISQLFERFKAAFIRNDLDTCTNLLSQLKFSRCSELAWTELVIKSMSYWHQKQKADKECICKLVVVKLTEFRSLPPLFEDSPNAVPELTLARDIYEHAVVLSVKSEDQDAFERDFFQLKPYYTDTWEDSWKTIPLYQYENVTWKTFYKWGFLEILFFKKVPYNTWQPVMGGVIPPSPKEYPILGLNLLRLLVQNRIAEFHTELELLSASALENPCIKHAVELEQSFMEGAYNRVLSARQTVPHETYVYFMDLLAKTVRDEIAGCSEKAYDYLSISDAKKILMFSSDQELSDYITEDHPEWEIKNGCVFFQKAKESAPCKEIPSLQLINQTLSYARELERIREMLRSKMPAMVRKIARGSDKIAVIGFPGNYQFE
ncbi:26S proteasome non-ATPase regulatory subunit 8 A [Asimina triloba]